MLSLIRNIFGYQNTGQVSKGVSSDPNWLRAVPTYTSGSSETVQDPYSQNVYVYAGIRAMSVNISGVDFKLKDKKTNEIIDDPNNPWYQVFKHPHRLLEKSQLWRATVVHYESQGTCFWLLQDALGKPISDPREVPDSMIPVGPDKVVPRFAKEDTNRENLLGWTYIKDKANNVLQPLEFYQVLRFYEYNPDNATKGFTGLIPAGLSVDIDYKTHLFNHNFFENGADFGGVLKYSGEGIDSSEMESMRDLWDDRHKGLSNNHRTPILGPGFDYKETGKSHKDMQFETLHDMTVDEIIASLNVPKQQVSLYGEINFATARVADKAFWTNNLIPKMNYFTSVINSHLLEFSGLEGFFDLSKVEALNESRDEKLRNAKILQELGYPLNEINSKLGLGMEEVDEDWANEATNVDGSEPTSVKPKRDDPDAEASKGEEVSIEQDISNLVVNSILGVANFDDNEIAEMSTKDIINLSIEGNQKAIDRYVFDYNKIVRNPIEKKMEPKIKGYILKLRKAQLKLLDKQLNKELKREDIEKTLFNSEKWDKTIIDMAKPFHAEAFDKSFDQVETELDGFISFNRGSNEVAEQLRQTNVAISQVNDTIQKQIRDTLAKGVLAGETPDQLRMRVATKFDNMLSRSATIAATEVGIASSKAKWIAMQAEDVLKKWLSSMDDKVRDPHVKFNKLPPKPMDYEYDTNLRRPLDNNADPGQICNCRCVLIAKRKKRI